jgi:hypothetical protein
VKLKQESALVLAAEFSTGRINRAGGTRVVHYQSNLLGSSDYKALTSQVAKVGALTLTIRLLSGAFKSRPRSGRPAVMRRGKKLMRVPGALFSGIQDK